ncbi:MAG: sigma-70 family RNA polymerase sigma factor [Bacteroidota bacterium]
MNTQQQEDFVAVVAQHQAIINNLCRLYYPDVEDQRDTRQDIILQLWKSFASFKGESQWSTWIYRVSLNTILGKIRKQKRQIDTTTTKLPNDQAAHLPIGADDDIQLLRTIIDGLEEADKAVVILHLEGYKNKEIATLLNISASNVSTRLHRIKTKLKHQYQKLNHAIE